MKTILYIIILLFNSDFLFGEYQKLSELEKNNQVNDSSSSNCDNYKIEIVDIKSDNSSNDLKEIYNFDARIMDNNNSNIPDSYILKHINSNSSDLRDELWSISKNDSVLLIKGKAISFKLNSQKTLLAYTKDNNHNLFIKNLSNDSIREFKLVLDSTAEQWIQLLKWSSDGNLLWCSLYSLYSYDLFLSYNYEIKKLQYFPWYKYSYHELVLNPDKGLLLYSDFPSFFISTDYDEFKNSDNKVTLYLHNFCSNEERIIMTSTAKEFKPILINSDYFEFKNPNSNSALYLKCKK